MDRSNTKVVIENFYNYVFYNVMGDEEFNRAVETATTLIHKKDQDVNEYSYENPNPPGLEIRGQREIDLANAYAAALKRIDELEDQNQYLNDLFEGWEVETIQEAWEKNSEEQQDEIRRLSEKCNRLQTVIWKVQQMGLGELFWQWPLEHLQEGDRTPEPIKGSES